VTSGQRERPRLYRLLIPLPLCPQLSALNYCRGASAAAQKLWRDKFAIQRSR